MFEDCRNPNGNYNGAKALAKLSGLSEQEITWTFERMKQLLREGKTRDEAKEIVAREAKAMPWKQPRCK